MYYKIKTMLQLIGNLVHITEPASLSTHRLYLKKDFFCITFTFTPRDHSAQQ